MINHLRTLLVNLSHSDASSFSELGDEIIPSGYKSRKIPSVLAGARVILFGADPDRAMLNYRTRQLLQCIDAAGLETLANYADKRVTYDIRQSKFYSREEFLPKVTPLGLASASDVVIVGSLAPCDASGKMRRTFTLSVDGSSNLTVVDNVFGARSVVELSINGGFSQLVSLNGSGLFVKLKNVTNVTYDIVAYSTPTRSIYELVSKLQSLSSANLEALFANTSSFGNEISLKNLWEKHPDPATKLSALSIALGYKTEKLPNRVIAVDTNVVVPPEPEPPTALDILASVGASTSPTSATTKKITEAFQPKLVLPFSSYLTAAGAGTFGFVGLGASDGTNNYGVSVRSNNAVTTSGTFRRHTATKSFHAIEGVGVTPFEGSCTSFVADGWTVDVSTNTGAAAFILNHIALGGADLEVSITQHQMNGTNAAQSFSHGLSGAPTALLFVSASYSTSPPGTTAGLLMSIGAWAESSQFNASIYSLNGASTTTTRRMLSNNGVCSFFDTAHRRELTVSSVDAVNVNCTYTKTATTYQSYFWMLAIRGCSAKVGTFACNGSTDPLTIDCAGITPKLFMPVMVSYAVDNINLIINGAEFSIGASDGTNNVSCGITDTTNVTTTSARRYQSSNSLVDYNAGGAKRFEATATFSGESVILTPTAASANYGQGAFLIIGE